MAGATEQERAQMDKAEKLLEDQVLAAERWALVVKAQFFTTDAQKAALKAIADERVRFNTWRSAWKGWALQGHEPDGYPYAVSFWLRIGDDIASALKAYSDGLYKGSLLAVVVNTTTQTAKDIATPSAWPTALKVVVGVVAVVVVIVTVNNVAGIARAIRG
ncbi:MAG: hypothetical protein ACJ8AT_31255 [Hyalangium sp.]|uniref:hypothetical protein n=1 Tax=Hyalangium sp. TaxID=2028555 RepID=UPI00389A9444